MPGEVPSPSRGDLGRVRIKEVCHQWTEEDWSVRRRGRYGSEKRTWEGQEKSQVRGYLGRGRIKEVCPQWTEEGWSVKRREVDM